MKSRARKRSSLRVEGLENRIVMDYASAVLADNPVGYWRFNEGAVGPVNDSAGANDTGTMTNFGPGNFGHAPAAAVGSGTAFSFDGVNQNLNLPQGLFNIWTTGAAFTFEAWFKVTPGQGGVILGNTGFGGGHVPAVMVGTDGRVYAETFWHGGVAPIVTGSTYNDGNWHYLVNTFSGGTQTLFIDTAQVGQVGGRTQFAYDGSGNYNYFIGTGQTGGWPGGNGGMYYLNGQVDEVAFYHKALTAQDVIEHYYGISNIANAVIWDGGAGDNNWQNPVNWVGDSNIPNTPTETAVFSHAGVGPVNVNGAMNIAGIVFANSAGSYTVGAGSLTLGSIVHGSTQNNTISANLTMVNPPSAPVASVGLFSGGDVGEGLDLDGNFLYAITVGGGAIGPVRDANFTSGASGSETAGYSTNGGNQIGVGGWGDIEYGPTTNDNNLETVLESIRYTGPTLNTDLAGLVPGQRYKLQLLYQEACCTARGFDILVEGNLVADEFFPGGLGLGVSRVVTYEFTATDTTLNISQPQAAGSGDANAILNGLTLEVLPPVGPSITSDAGLLTLSGVVDFDSNSLVVDGDGDVAISGTLTSDAPNQSIVRFVQIEKQTVGPVEDSSTQLHVGELEVFAVGVPAGPNGNVPGSDVSLNNPNDLARSALGASVFSASNVGGHGSPGDVIDGEEEQGLPVWTKWAGPGQKAEITINMGQDVSVGTVRVHQRNDGCCQDRLSNFKVKLFANNAGSPGALLAEQLFPGIAPTDGFAEFAFDVSTNPQLIKQGSGTLTLSGNNTYGGTTTVNGGVLIAASNTALGTSGAGTTVNTGAELAVQGGISSGEPIDVIGGTIRNLAGANTLTGDLSTAAGGGVAGSSTTISLFTGGDVGEGLDLDGNFPYAVNVRGPGGFTIRDTSFTTDAAAGVAVTAENEILGWQNPAYGGSANDLNLNTIGQSIRWTDTNNGGIAILGVDLANLVAGNRYKLQLLFHEPNNGGRGFDVSVEGALIADNFSVGGTPGHTSDANGVVITHEFLAGDNVLNIVLNGAGAPFGDQNPVLQGFTLEAFPPTPASILSDAGTLNLDGTVELGGGSELIFGGAGDINVNGNIAAGLNLASLDSLGTGTYTASAGGETFNAFVHNDGSNSWLLVGRGREGWEFDDNGQDSTAAVSQNVGTSGAFIPAAYSETIINDLIAQAGIDMQDVEIRIRRAEDTAGATWQEARWNPTTNTTWEWNFSNPGVDNNTGGFIVDYSIVAGAFSGHNATVGTVDNCCSPSNGAGRIFTWGWSGHSGLRGFSYGGDVSSGDFGGTNFLWSNNHSIPYTEVYIRALAGSPSGSLLKTGSGTLRINGTTPADIPIEVEGGTLGGTGVINGDVTVAAGAAIFPGPGAANGDLTINGDAVVSPLGIGAADITSTGNDKVFVNGGVTILGALGNVNVLGGFDPPHGSVYEIIQNDGVDPIVGEFVGAAEGSLVVLGTKQFQVTYIYNAETDTPGTGNDFALIAVNRPPTAVAGGPYSVSEGGSVMLDATGSSDIDADPIVSYAWDIDGDLDFNDGVPAVAQPTVTWAMLLAVGINDGFAGPGGNLLLNKISVRVSDGEATNDSPQVNLRVLNAPPTAVVGGQSSGVPGTPITINLSATDPSPVDAAASFDYLVDWGDGNVEPFSGAGVVPAQHAYLALGLFTITVIATDKDGADSAAVTKDVLMIPVGKIGNDIVAAGTNGDDQIIFTTANGSVSVKIKTAGVTSSYGPFPTNGLTKLIANGLDGNDQLTVTSSKFAFPVVFSGGGGNDYLAGGSLNDELNGDAGNDRLLGALGDDTLDGGDDNDSLDGGAGQDTVLGGAGNDKAFGGAGNDVLNGGGDNDSMDGGLGNDILRGGDGNDTVVGNSGDDIVLGGAGNDRLVTGAGNDVLLGGEDKDSFDGGAGDDLLVTGTTDLDNETDDSILLAALDAWTNLREVTLLGTIAGDAETEQLVGGIGADYFYMNANDKAKDFKVSQNDLIFFL